MCGDEDDVVKVCTEDFSSCWGGLTLTTGCFFARFSVFEDRSLLEEQVDPADPAAVIAAVAAFAASIWCTSHISAITMAAAWVSLEVVDDFGPLFSATLFTEEAEDDVADVVAVAAAAAATADMMRLISGCSGCW